jgi:preprotein translocase subunit SecG
MTTLTRSDFSGAARLLARATAVAAVIAVVTSMVLIATTGSVEVALFSIFAAAGGAYAGKVGWGSR